MTPRLCRKDLPTLISTFLKSQLNYSVELVPAGLHHIEKYTLTMYGQPNCSKTVVLDIVYEHSLNSCYELGMDESGVHSLNTRHSVWSGEPGAYTMK